MKRKEKFASMLSGWKLFLFVIVTYTVLFLIAFQGYIISKQSTSAIEKQYNQIIFDKMDALSVNMINYLNYLDDFARTLSVKPDLKSMIRENRDGTREAVEGALNYFRLRFPLYIQILTAQGRVFAYPPIDRKEEEQFKTTLASFPWYGQRLVLDNSYPRADVAADFHFSAFPNALYVSKNIVQDDRSLGTLTIKMNGTLIETMLDTVRINEANAVFILSPEGRILFRNEPSSAFSGDLASLGTNGIDGLIRRNGEGSGSGQIRIADQDCYFIYKLIPSTNWEILSIVPLRSLNAESVGVWQTTAMTTAFSVLLIVSSFCILYIKLTLPLQRMSRIVRAASEGATPEPYDYRGFKELETLNRGMYRFFEQIQLHIRTIRQSESEKRQLEMHVLQAQMRPHFWHNSLNALRFMALLHGDSTMADAILALTRMLDYTLKNTGVLFGTVEEEKDYAIQYIRFHEIRSMQKIDVKLDLDVCSLQARIPKFTLQPLLENAVTHGFRAPFAKVPSLAITTRLADGTLTIRIADNGNGMDDDALRLLLFPRAQEGGGRQTSGISLLNLQERIRLEYGEPYGIRVVSRLGEGTEVVVTLPWMTDAKKEGELP
ncbi:sensor histidine kinase [Paenibacillus elgii]|uniref:sensor histidine kinase n=1 Tax=Paenibacillus elgii TaxID=189691 RepID=UPI00204140A7|nr:sensor histidine kinase [Paenibacillus elgii]MCM3271903.1 histidine kinase [Paenibacillus elgii]